MPGRGRMDHLNHEEDRSVRRQSAMRSRLQKARYDKLRMVLNLKNKALKQLLAYVIQEKELLDAQYEFVKQAKERLQLQLIPAESEYKNSI